MSPLADSVSTDTLDIRILRTMGVLPYGHKPQGADALKATHIARVLGVTPETVRDRIARMERLGVIRGYEVYPNLRHFGLDMSGFLFTIPDDDRRGRISKEVEPVEGLLEISHFLGPEVCVEVSYRNAIDRERKLRLLATLTGDAAPREFYRWGFPPVPGSLSRLDWRILRALRGRGRRPLQEVARELGISYRSVKRHYNRMATEGSLFIIPVLDLSKDPGLFPFGLLFYLKAGDRGDTLRAILTEFENSLVFSQVPASPHFGNVDLAIFADSPAAVEAMTGRGAAIPGVERVVAVVRTGATRFTRWIDELIENRIQATAS